jgi:hypothetical protein
MPDKFIIHSCKDLTCEFHKVAVLKCELREYLQKQAGKYWKDTKNKDDIWRFINWVCQEKKVPKIKLSKQYKSDLINYGGYAEGPKK